MSSGQDYEASAAIQAITEGAHAIVNGRESIRMIAEILAEKEDAWPHISALTAEREYAERALADIDAIIGPVFTVLAASKGDTAADLETVRAALEAIRAFVGRAEKGSLQ